MPYTTWSRRLPGVPLEGVTYLDGQLQPAHTQRYVVGLQEGDQTTYSFRGDKQRDRDARTGREIRGGFRDDYRRRYDTGNEFRTTSRRPLQMIGSGVYNLAHPAYQKDPDLHSLPVRYRGGLFVHNENIPPWVDPRPPSQEKIEMDGRRAISITTPTRPEAELAVLLGELKERFLKLPLQQILSRQGPFRQNVGGEYLNVEFGWKPMIAAIQDLARSIAQANLIVEQLRRDSGKVVRRRAQIAEVSYIERTETDHTAQFVYDKPLGYLSGAQDPYFGATYASRQPPVLVLDEFSSRTWFSGAYSYYLAESHSFLGRMEEYAQKADRLLGTRITPDVLWELTPWSWLLDWEGDLGNFFSNVTHLSSDSTVLRYGYIMHETKSRRTQTVARIMPAVYNNIPAMVPDACPLIGESITKIRTRATPYGFGLKTEDFSDRQWAILAALGLSKGGTRSLRR